MDHGLLGVPSLGHVSRQHAQRYVAVPQVTIQWAYLSAPILTYHDGLPGGRIAHCVPGTDSSSTNSSPSENVFSVSYQESTRGSRELKSHIAIQEHTQCFDYAKYHRARCTLYEYQGALEVFKLKSRGQEQIPSSPQTRT